jgi:orotate phosphoribosyltransferase
MQSWIKVGSSYFEDAHRQGLVDDARHLLRGVEYDTLVGTGYSGVVAVAKLSLALGKHALYLRKPDAASHAKEFGQPYGEGELGDRWIFVDDFISSGKTIRAAMAQMEALQARYNVKSTFVGVYLYQQDTRAGMKGFHEADDSYILNKLTKPL